MNEAAAEESKVPVYCVVECSGLTADSTHCWGVPQLGYLSYLISSKISGFSRSLFFIRSFMAVMILLALSSAPCLELFSAAPTETQSAYPYASG
jgi:hypothetical protein